MGSNDISGLGLRQVMKAPPPRVVEQIDREIQRLQELKQGIGGEGSDLPAVPDAGPRSGIALDRANQSTESDRDWVRRVFMEELGRDPGPEGYQTYMTHLANGSSREQLRAAIADSLEAKMPETKARKAWVAAQAGSEGKDPVETIKNDPRYAGFKADPSKSLQENTEAAMKWVRETFADLFSQIEAVQEKVPFNKDKHKRLLFEATGHLIGALRANGIDAQRLARHTHNQMGDYHRYVNDALVLPDGRAIDWLGGNGSELQFHDLDVPSPKTDRNFGVVPLQPGVPLSSSTLGI